MVSALEPHSGVAPKDIGKEKTFHWAGLRTVHLVIHLRKKWPKYTQTPEQWLVARLASQGPEWKRTGRCETRKPGIKVCAHMGVSVEYKDFCVMC